MTFSMRRWGVGRLLGAWAGYWVALAAVTFAPFARWVWNLSRIPGEHGSASFSAGNAGLTLTALKDGVIVYSAVASFFEIALWVAGPPLALWLMWLLMRPSTSSDAAPHTSAAFGALPDAARGGWHQPITPTSSPSPIDRRDGRDGRESR